MYFQYIGADCPWHYNDRRKYRKDNPEQATRFGIGASGAYSAQDVNENGSTMTQEELESLGPDIQALSMDNSYLSMWVTCPRIEVAFPVMRAWGFDYKTVSHVWVKTTQPAAIPPVHPPAELLAHLKELAYSYGMPVEDVHNALSTYKDMTVGQDVVGPGHYTGSNVELVLFGVRGSMFHATKGYPKPRQILRHPRVTDENGKVIHSRKPELFQDMMDAWLDPHLTGAKMELFATRHRPGYVCLGHALSGNDIRNDLRWVKQQLDAAHGQA